MVLNLPDKLFPGKIEIWNFLGAGKTGISGENLSEQRREPTTNSYLGSMLGFEKPATMMEGESSYQCATLVFQ